MAQDNTPDPALDPDLPPDSPLNIAPLPIPEPPASRPDLNEPGAGIERSDDEPADPADPHAPPLPPQPPPQLG